MNFKQLEEIISLGKNKMILVSGRPASGKTQFGINVFNNIALKQDIPTLFFSLESSKETIINNSSGTLYVDDTPNVTLDYIEEQCQKLKQNHNIGFVIIDYLQLINDTDVENVGARLRALAEELGLTILVLSQLLGAETRPTLADLKRSRAIADVSDVVLFLHKEGAETTNKDVEIIVAKNNGGTNNNLKEIQDLLDRAKSYRAELSKPALDDTFIKDLKLDDDTKEIAVNEKDNIYVNCRITKKEAITGCIKIVKTKNKQIKVTIPAEIENGQQLILKGAGTGYSNLIVSIIIK